jgi:hypothetical protein
MKVGFSAQLANVLLAGLEPFQARAEAIGGPSACSSARNEAARVVRDHTADHGEPRPPTVAVDRVSHGRRGSFRFKPDVRLTSRQ